MLENVLAVIVGTLLTFWNDVPVLNNLLVIINGLLSGLLNFLTAS